MRRQGKDEEIEEKLCFVDVDAWRERGKGREGEEKGEERFSCTVGASKLKGERKWQRRSRRTGEEGTRGEEQQGGIPSIVMQQTSANPHGSTLKEINPGSSS